MFFAKKTKVRTLGIGTRLTLFGAALVTLLIAVVSVALYVATYLSLRSQIDVFLEGEIREFMQTVNEHHNDDEGLQASIRRELGVRSRNDLGFRLLSLKGAPLVTSAARDDLQGPWRPPDDWADAQPRLLCENTQSPQGDKAFRICSLRVTTADGRSCTAQCSYDLDQLHESVARVGKTCLLILLVAPLLAMGVGGFLARRSLRPVRRIIESAKAIGTGDLDSRLPILGTGDEMDQLTATLNGMLARIDRKVREVQRFTADASHELRTPLTALRGATEVALMRERTVEGLRRVLEDNIEQFDRLQKIAGDLLLLSRLDAGEKLVRCEVADLVSAVSDAVELYRPLAEERSIHLTLQKNGPISVRGDLGRMRQVFGNVLHNAIKFSRESGHIAVCVESENGFAKAVIEDDGIGIAEGDLPKIFDRFFRADSARTPIPGGGTGLGLSITQAIIIAHQGRISVESQLGKGTRVTIRIPRIETLAPA